LWPAVGRILTNNFVRGAISGLGVVNLVAGFVDLSGVIGGRDRPSGVQLGDGHGRA